MNKKIIVAGIVGFAAGLIMGFAGANSLNRNAQSGQVTDPNQVAPALNQTGASQPQSRNSQGGMQADVQKVLDKADKEPDNYEAQIEAGQMFARIQNFEKGLVYFQKAQRLKPDDFEANAALGNAFLDARQFENAETYYQKALDIKPDDVTIRSDLATTFIERTQPDYDRAFLEFKKALVIDPKHEPTLYNMAIAYLRKGDKENAQKSLEQLKEENPESDLVPKLQQIISRK